MKNPQDFTLEDILARKASGRHKLARLSFGEKVKIVEDLRDRLAPFDAIKKRRKQTAGNKAASLQASAGVDP